MVTLNKHNANSSNTAIICNKTSNFKVVILDVYPLIPWELVADTFGTERPILETTAIYYNGQTTAYLSLKVHVTWR
jgi:hypothetical protein